MGSYLGGAAEMVIAGLRNIGRTGLSLLRGMGQMAVFLAAAGGSVFRRPIRPVLLLRHLRVIGVTSTFVVLLTAAFTGMVLGLQLHYTLRKFGSEAVLGSAVGLSIIRELGPVLAALMVTARAGSAITAEIGVMRLTEQIDALEAMAIDSLQYLIAPRLLAGLLAMPLLVAIFDVVGIVGGYVVGVHLVGGNAGSYWSSLEAGVEWQDVSGGVLKSLSFGLIVSWVCCYKGYHTRSSAEGLGRATTEAVVLCAVLILAWDYFLTSVLL